MSTVRLFLLIFAMTMFGACEVKPTLAPAVTIQGVSTIPPVSLTSTVSSLPQVGSSPQITPTPGFSKYVFPLITPDPKCAPPCFYGIMPGQTTMTETLSLLRASPSQVIGNKLVWKVTAVQMRVPSNFVVFRQNKASVIVLNEPFTVTFQEIISRYGDPESVAIGWPGGEMTVDDFILAYPTKGIAFLGSALRPNDPNEWYILRPEMLVFCQIYFEPNKNKTLSPDDSWLRSVTSGLKIGQWRGFGVSMYEP